MAPTYTTDGNSSKESKSSLGAKSAGSALSNPYASTCGRTDGALYVPADRGTHAWTEDQYDSTDAEEEKRMTAIQARKNRKELQQAKSESRRKESVAGLTANMSDMSLNSNSTSGSSNCGKGAAAGHRSKGK
jgi:hypothetical protein